MDFQYLLILLFVFWVLEAVGKARQRGRPEAEDDDAEVPDAVELPHGQPRTLWEEIQEIARQQRQLEQVGKRTPPQPEPQRQLEPQLAAPRLARSEERSLERIDREEIAYRSREGESLIARPVRAARADLKEQAAEPPKSRRRRGRTITGPQRPDPLDPRALRRLPRHDLERLLVMREVLGPPLALRDHLPGED